MPYDPLDRVRAFEEDAAKASAAVAAKSEKRLKDQADQLEKDGWTDAAARARTQLAEEEKPVKAAEKSTAKTAKGEKD